MPTPSRSPMHADQPGPTDYLRTPLGIVLLGFLALGVCLLVMCVALGLHAGHMALLFPFIMLVVFPAAALAVYAEQSRRDPRAPGARDA